MSKRNSSGDLSNAVHICKPCGLAYNTEVQLMRHKSDRHGPQVYCSLCHSKTYILPSKRTDVQRRHLIAKHKYTKDVTINRIRELFLPYFEECETPLFNHSMRSSVVVPSAPAASSHYPAASTHIPAASTHIPAASTHIPAASTHTPAASSHIPAASTHTPAASSHIPAATTHTPAASSHIPAAFSPSLPDQQAYPAPALPISTSDTLIDSTYIPDSLAAFLSEESYIPTPIPPRTPDRTSTPDLTDTPPLTHSTPSKISNLPDLSLDWTFPNPRLAMPVRYKSPLKQLSITTDDFASTHSSPAPPDNTSSTSSPLPAAPENTIQIPDIPLESSHTEDNTTTFIRYPTPRPDNTAVISGVDGQRTPEFPPRRLTVPARKALDPRLLFRDAPSGFLAGSMARLAAYHQKDILKNAAPQDIHVTFEHQNFSITRSENVQLADGRTFTMKTTCTLNDHLKMSRTTQTFTEED